MTIKRRLFLSNVLMIVVPALVTALTGLLCMVMVVSVIFSPFSFPLRYSSFPYRERFCAIRTIQNENK